MSGSSWKVAYADFVTALMAFFLLMWILAAADDTQKSMLAGYFAEPGARTSDAKPSDTGLPAGHGTGGVIHEMDQTSQAVLTYLRERVQKERLSAIAQVSAKDSGVLLRVGSSIVFDHNQADMSFDGARMVMAVADVMRLYKVKLVISGHTDSGETGEPAYSSKWELAAARSSIVTQYLVDQAGIPASQITCVSYADTRPTVPPDSAKTDNPDNRRVEFLFVRAGIKINSALN